MKASLILNSTLVLLLLGIWNLEFGIWNSDGLAQQQSNRRMRRPGQSVHHTIRGRVYLPDGRPAETQVRVTLRSIRGGALETFTDSGGSFTFTGVPSNSYELVVWGDDDFETIVEPIDLLGDISNTTVRNIVLRRKEGGEGNPPKPGVVSVTELERAIPPAAQQEYERGMNEASQGRYEQAVVHFQRAIDKHRRYFQAHYEMGLAYVQLSRLREAQTAFTEAIAIEPRAPQPLVNLGMIQLQQQAYEPAVETFSRAVALDGSDWRAALGLGIALLKAKKDEAWAEAELKKALALGQGPEAATAHLYLINLYLRRGDQAEALKHAEAYLQEVPEAENKQESRSLIARIRNQEPR
jgi:tetratricopeptide (TPR) repeat protein